MNVQAQEHKASDYLYQHVTQDVLSNDFAFSDDAPRPGDPLPLFDLPLTDGSRIRTAELLDSKPVLLITGSFTCPMTASSNPLLKELHADYGSMVQFIMLHVREAHPGENFDQPDNFESKLAYARDLAQRDQLPWPIAVDDVDGTVHRQLDEKPNAAYLADPDGRIVFRALWAGDVHGLREAIGAVIDGRQPRKSESRRRLVPMARGIGMMGEVLESSGPRATRDLWRVAPPMAVIAKVADLYRPLPPAWRTAAAVATIAGGVALTVSLIRGAARRS